MTHNQEKQNHLTGTDPQMIQKLELGLLKSLLHKCVQGLKGKHEHDDETSQQGNGNYKTTKRKLENPKVHGLRFIWVVSSQDTLSVIQHSVHLAGCRTENKALWHPQSHCEA